VNGVASTTSEVRAAWTPEAISARAREEARRARNYPISRWYLRPLAGIASRYLMRSSLQPCHVTWCGFACTLAAVATILFAPAYCALAAALVMAAWFCDRLDGQLARRQGTASAYGAWLDGNLDELADIALHTAFAYAASAEWGNLAWWLWGAFVSGKYLFMYGLASDVSNDTANAQTPPATAGHWSAQLYHLPANADVRIHLAMAAAYCGAWGFELALVAAYYQFRWLARHVLVARRLRREAA
jgi:phosphatidylglycerophosphate synthase